MATPSTAQLVVIKRRTDLFQYDFYHLYQGCNDQNKSNGLHKTDSERIQDSLLDDKSNQGGQDHHEGYGSGHP